MKSKIHEYQKNNFTIMSKKIILCFGLASFLMFASCDKKTEKTVETTETTTVVQDTVVKEVPAEEPKEEDGTSVKINNNGVDVNSKDVDVEIKK
ncbi:hypothetical protein [Flavobacterium wongokense]|uniref:hypothetical protein n=1 Tax=Flavobacterium wongokense TaxID=2910674 RepID=UPI001F268D95|nr:hypothetical protein [Flavobacterium sp. WG47]MCF6132214.1 hypothetical protein [Flavobacterium sp. WG47]